MSDAYKNDNDKITEIYEEVIFFMPFSPTMNLNKVLTEIRKLTVSDIFVSPHPEVTLAKL